jgi:hypothetical protein
MVHVHPFIKQTGTKQYNAVRLSGDDVTHLKRRRQRKAPATRERGPRLRP